MLDRQYLALKSKLITAVLQSKKKIDTKRKYHNIIKETTLSKLCIEPLMNMDFVNTEEFRKISEYNAKQPFSIEGNNEINTKFDLMIAVPVYNGEKYVKKCIDSLLNQETKYTYEIVIVNDGSTDETANILKEYESNNIVRIITQANKGLSAARNKALKCITGKYVLLVDADDELSNNAVQLLLEKAIENNADIIEGSYTRFNNDGEFDPHYHINDNSISNPEIPLFGFPWGKVIRADIFRNIVFPEGYIYEDSIFAYCIHHIAKLKYTISDICYKYRDNPEGICATSGKSKSSIDTYTVSFYLWSYYYQNFTITKRFFELVVGQTILNYLRAQFQDEEILKAAFRLTQRIYVSIFDKPIVENEKYIVFDKCMRRGTYDAFCNLASLWENW